MATHDAQMLKGVLSMVLLHLVAQEDDYGYALVVRLHAEGLTDLSEGSVYPALTRLESGGLLSSRLVRSSSGPARKYYVLTTIGRAELARAQTAWHALVDTVDRVLVTDPHPRSTA